MFISFSEFAARHKSFKLIKYESIINSTIPFHSECILQMYSSVQAACP